MGFGLGAYVVLPPQLAGVRYSEFLAPGLVASAVMMAATFEVAWNTYMRMHAERIYDALVATPAQLEDVVAGEILWAATRASIYGIVMTAVFAALGLVGSPLALAVVPLATLSGLAFGAIGMSYTASVRGMDQLTFYFTLFITPQFLFSGIFFPLDALPPFVQAAAKALPLHHVVEFNRAAFFGTLGLEHLVHVGYLAALLVAFYPIAVWRVKRLLVQ